MYRFILIRNRQEFNMNNQYCLNLDFGSQGSFSYNVTTFKLMDYTIEELNKKKMIILKH